MTGPNGNEENPQNIYTLVTQIRNEMIIGLPEQGTAEVCACPKGYTVRLVKTIARVIHGRCMTRNRHRNSGINNELW